MKGPRVGILVVAILLAIGSYWIARHEYQSKNSMTFTIRINGSHSQTLGWGDEKLFGDWMKDEVFFAIIVPVALLAGGAVLAWKK